MIDSTNPFDQPSALCNIDLNLLVLLDTLLEERSVSRAAKRVGLSQSAMSHALGRLRELIGDALLVRVRGEMIPTPRALQLAGPLRHSLRALQRALSRDDRFDPARSSRSFAIAAPDYAELTVLPAVIAHATKQAPGIVLTILPVYPRRAIVALEDGSADLLCDAEVPDEPGLVRQQLFTDDYVCLARKGHPRVKGRLPLRTFLSLSHVLITPTCQAGGIVDQKLDEIGLRRHIAVRVPRFAAGPLVAAQSDLVVTAPRRVGQQMARYLPLQLLEPPLDLGSFTVYQVWHQRLQDDDAHRWLRNTLVDSIGSR